MLVLQWQHGSDLKDPVNLFQYVVDQAQPLWLLFVSSLGSPWVSGQQDL